MNVAQMQLHCSSVQDIEIKIGNLFCAHRLLCNLDFLPTILPVSPIVKRYALVMRRDENHKHETLI